MTDQYNLGFERHRETWNSYTMELGLHGEWCPGEKGTPLIFEYTGGGTPVSLIYGHSACYRFYAGSPGLFRWCLWINAEATEVFEEHEEL